MVLQLEPILGAAPGLIRPDITALDVTFGRAAAEIGEITKRRGAFFGRFRGAREIPFLAHPGRHPGAEPQAADQSVFQSILFHQIKIFAACGMPPHENILIGQTSLDQGPDRLGAHAKSINGQPVSKFRVAWSFTDDKLGAALGDGQPRFAAVMAGQRDRQHRDTERSNMLGNAYPCSSRIGPSKVRILFRTIRGKDKLVLVGRAAVNHDHGDVADRCFDRLEQPTMDVPLKQLCRFLRIGVTMNRLLHFLDGKLRARERIGECFIIIKGHVVDKVVEQANTVL